ncbi:MAG: amidohydrolase family protein [Gammaproteobacteria bacterium]|nr:amidohydrolase family protein [Gammaproteobacteria bacterium]
MNEFLETIPVFDSHLHIIEGRHQLHSNDGYLPPAFSCDDYLERMRPYQLCGGAIVSGSFQGFDRGYLVAALQRLGASYVGVIQLPVDVTDKEIKNLHKIGVRAIRFNLKRGGSEGIAHLPCMASRVYDIAGWHVELYVDSDLLKDLYGKLRKLPAVSIDHLGLTRSGLKQLLKLVDNGASVKASGFGRVDFDVKGALRQLYAANPDALMFGSDLPSTRAPRPYMDNDFLLVLEALGAEAAPRVFSQNAIKLYKPASQ